MRSIASVTGMPTSSTRLTRLRPRVAELRAFYDGTEGNVDFIKGCIAKSGSWLARVGSRNVARDLDRLRAALGDERLNYLGYSYGTVIGSVYAQQFPDRVGRMVLDGPVDLSEDEAERRRRLRRRLRARARQLSPSLRGHCKLPVPIRWASARGAAYPPQSVRGRPDAADLHVERDSAPGAAPGSRRSTPACSPGSTTRTSVGRISPTRCSSARHGDGTFLQLLADSYNGRHARRDLRQPRRVVRDHLVRRSTRSAGDLRPVRRRVSPSVEGLPVPRWLS